MTIDLESRLREAFEEFPDDAPDPADAATGAIARATRMRRRRSLLVGTSVTAGMAAAVAAAIVGTTLQSAPATGQLLPASSNTASARPAPGVTTTPAAARSAIRKQSAHVQAQNDEFYAGKQLAQVRSTLLPHGSQLPTGMRYEAARHRLTSTSRINATTNAVFLSSGLGSNVPGANPSAPDNFGMVATVQDLAGNHKPNGHPYGDGDAAQRSLNVNITRFKSSAYAASAIAKAEAKNGPIIWFSAKKVPMPWSGVPGAQGNHYLYDLGVFGAQEDCLAVQIVGEFIVSADSADPKMSTNAVTAMVDNLRSAKLVK